MKFELPVLNVVKYSVEDILTSSGAPATEAGPMDGIGLEGGVCNGTMADYYEDNCPAY